MIKRVIKPLLMLMLFSCEQFDDPTMSALKKPEILSIVLDPPEAAPGEFVRASFLLADGKGPIQADSVLWLPVDISGEEAGRQDPDQHEMDELEKMFEKYGIDPSFLLQPAVEFMTGPAEQYEFDKDGFSTQPVSLFVAVGDLPEDVTADVGKFMSKVEEYIESGDVKSSFRTLIISNRHEKNTNPVVLSITAHGDGFRETDISFVTSADDDIAGKRQEAADDPVIVKPETEIFFRLEIENQKEQEDALLYQWITTSPGGTDADSKESGFGGFRKRDQPFQTPGSFEPGDGETDQTGIKNVNPRTDPNLYPVWVIIRNSGVPNQLGQSWAEFYVRVTP